MTSIEKVLGYKGLSAEYKGCDGFQYKVGETYALPPDDDGDKPGKPYVSTHGFHFCKFPEDVFRFVSNDPKNGCRIVRVCAYVDPENGYEISEAPDGICACNKITILGELSLEQTLQLIPDGRHVKEDGTVVWYRNGLIDSYADRAAYIPADNQSMMWYRMGVLHRDGDQPAHVTADGKLTEYYQNGQLHRNPENGPAWIMKKSNGRTLMRWCDHGKLLREEDKGPMTDIVM
jgi:hypothetical protein